MAIQKSGRLNEDSLKLLKACGIKIDNGKDQLKVNVPNFPIEILYLRNSDIPQYLEDGVADVAIVGENLLIEKGKKQQSLKSSVFQNVGCHWPSQRKLKQQVIDISKEKELRPPIQIRSRTFFQKRTSMRTFT